MNRKRKKKKKKGIERIRREEIRGGGREEWGAKA